MIEFEEGANQVDATIVAEGLGIEPSLVQERRDERNLVESIFSSIEPLHFEARPRLW